MYVDLTSDGGSFRDANAWRHQVAFNSGCLADVDRFGRGDVAFDRAQHDDRLGEYIRRDLPVQSNGESVVVQLDLAFDLTFDDQVLLAAQLALDDHRLPDRTQAMLHEITPFADLVSY